MTLSVIFLYGIRILIVLVAIATLIDGLSLT
jgi:hypothetical protein